MYNSQTVTIMSDNYFSKLAAIDCSEHVESKGKFSYLSWAWAVNELGKLHPDSIWNVKRFPTLENPEILVPYMQTPLGFFVEVEVIIDGVSRSQIHPVLNHQNRPIASPNTFDINTSIQRALVKAIGLHGLGLYIYAGEDIPPDMGFSKGELMGFSKAIAKDDFMRIRRLEIDDKDKYMALHSAYLSTAPQGEKGKARKALEDGLKAATQTIQGYVDHICENPDSYQESMAEFSEVERDLVTRLLPEDIKGAA